MNIAFAAHAGLWGVLVIDMVQFFIKMSAVIAAAYFAVNAPEVGGLDALIARLSATPGPNGVNYLSILPDFTNQWDLAVAVFIMPIAVQSWAVWYPGSEPGGGSYIAQRMLASRSERDALGAVLFFNIAHYVLRPWPWILVALASIVVYPELSDIQAAFPDLDPSLIGHDIAYPAMLKFLPVGFIGLMVGGLIAASSSTILTHLNWGASYLVHDFYRRFIRGDADEAHYVRVGRLATVGLFLCSSGLVYLMDTAKDAFDVILQVGAGTGLLYLVRWFWWRVNAWCEVVAMVSSLLVSLLWLVLARAGSPVSTHVALMLTVLVTTICWLAAAYLAPPTDPSGAGGVLSQGAAARTGLGQGPAGRRITGRRSRAGRRPAASPARMAGRVHGHLVVAVRRGQRPLRADRHGLGAGRRGDREHAGAGQRRPATVDGYFSRFVKTKLESSGCCMQSAETFAVPLTDLPSAVTFAVPFTVPVQLLLSGMANG